MRTTGILQIADSTHIESNVIAQQRLVQVISKQYPLLVGGFAKHRYLGIKLNLIGFLGILPC